MSEGFHQEIARCLFRESNDALFVFDPRDHRVVDANPVAQRMTGLLKDELCTKRIWQLFSGSETVGLTPLIEAYQSTGFFHSREGFSLYRSVGEPLPVNISVSRMHTRPEPLGLVVARDISERLQLVESLQESERRFRSVVESAQLLIWTMSAAGTISSVNPEFEFITNWTRDEWLNQSLSSLIHAEDFEVASRSFEEALLHGFAPPLEVRIATKFEGYIPLEMVSLARVAQGRASGVSVIARNISEKKKLQRVVSRVHDLVRAQGLDIDLNPLLDA